MKSWYISVYKLTILVNILSGPSVGWSKELEWVLVAAENSTPNPPDPLTGKGSVGYSFSIGKYEITLEQYTDFLNAIGKSDPHFLYNPNMATDLNVAGIARTGVNGDYSYSVIGAGTRPVTYVSWFDCARFANWLHNGASANSNTENGAYLLNGAQSGVFLRESGAKFWIPSENEWYKSAYWDPTPGAGGGDNYWLYPTGSNTFPDNVVGPTPNNANHYDWLGIPGTGTYSVTQTNAGTYLSNQNYLTPVGSFTGSPSPSGTYDQGGNVGEILEDQRVRGASWVNSDSSMASTVAGSSGSGYSAGFRLASSASVASSNAIGVATKVVNGNFYIQVMGSGLFSVRRSQDPATFNDGPILSNLPAGSTYHFIEQIGENEAAFFRIIPN